MRDGALLLIGFISILISPRHVKREQLNWAPFKEVCLVFAIIFITLIPVSVMLQAGLEGPFAPLIHATQKAHPAFYYFWLTGLFSAFLDNAPTYVVFFKMAGGDAATLMTVKAPILAAISLGAVFMGAMTYIGNAPNFMVRAIAGHYKIKMPSFGRYMVWSGGILLPILIGISIVLFY
jgi:Na+/H+ antiporter NhaD/arsenite permease-like protein